MPTLEEFAAFITQVTEREKAAGKEKYMLEVPEIAEYFNISQYQAMILLKEYVIAVYLTPPAKTI